MAPPLVFRAQDKADETAIAVEQISRDVNSSVLQRINEFTEQIMTYRQAGFHTSASPVKGNQISQKQEKKEVLECLKECMVPLTSVWAKKFEILASGESAAIKSQQQSEPEIDVEVLAAGDKLFDWIVESELKQVWDKAEFAEKMSEVHEKLYFSEIVKAAGSYRDLFENSADLAKKAAENVINNPSVKAGAIKLAEGANTQAKWDKILFPGMTAKNLAQLKGEWKAFLPQKFWGLIKPEWPHHDYVHWRLTIDNERAMKTELQFD
jgi:hypothetical protein